MTFLDKINETAAFLKDKGIQVLIQGLDRTQALGFPFLSGKQLFP